MLQIHTYVRTVPGIYTYRYTYTYTYTSVHIHIYDLLVNLKIGQSIIGSPNSVYCFLKVLYEKC